MPIKDLSETVRLPRLGKIHLGVKSEKGYPVKTDYFVFDKEHPDYKSIVALYTDKPKSLNVLIPVEDEELWASQYYKSYDRTHGLICKGTGETATRLVLNPANPDLQATEMIDQACLGKACPDYIAKKCHERMNLRVVLPELPGLGVWQIDTGSINSILNINSCARLIKKAFGRISMIPLQLTLEAVEVNNPENHKKQTAYVLNLRTSVTMAQLADDSRDQRKNLLLGAPDMQAQLENEFDEQVKTDIEELWPEDEPTERKPEPAAVVNPPAPTPAPEPVSEPQRHKIFAVAKEKGITTETIKAMIARRFKKDSTTALTKADASELIEKLEKGYRLNEAGEWEL